MQSAAIIVASPDVNFGQFLTVASQAIGYSPATAVDNSRRDVCDAEKYASILACMVDQQATVGIQPHLQAHLTFSVLVVAAERDMQDVQMLCSGMPAVVADTIARGIQIAVITGNLSQWRDAVVSGCQFEVQPAVRQLFNKILGLFESQNIKVWQGYTRTEHTDNTLLLEARP